MNNAHIPCILQHNFIIEILFDNLLPNVFIASAERTGAAIFKDELDFARTRLLKEMRLYLIGIYHQEYD
jgi:hypothetical protein